MLTQKYDNILHRHKVSEKKASLLDDETARNVKLEKEKIKEFLGSKFIAPWFRGTSIFHMNGTHLLFNAIRDDTEQSTSHRVRRCLNMIGLDPVVSSKFIKLLMRLSRGNDLAFLWFLWELCYKTPKPGYTLNEQLICTSIFYLDVIPTLRELDKLLPIGKASRKSTKIYKKKFKKYKQNLLENYQKSESKYILPYFQRQRRPIKYGKSLTLREPKFKVSFGLYDQYKDPQYICHNEENRWYSNYKFQISQRIIHRILREEINKIIGNTEKTYSFSNHEIIDNIPILCEYHKCFKAMEEKMEHELRVKALYKCLEYYLHGEFLKKERGEKIKESLYKEIEIQLEKFRKQASTIEKSMTLQAIGSHGTLIDLIMGEEDNVKCKNMQMIEARVSLKDKEIKNNKENFETIESIKKCKKKKCFEIFSLKDEVQIENIGDSIKNNTNDIYKTTLNTKDSNSIKPLMVNSNKSNKIINNPKNNKNNNNNKINNLKKINKKKLNNKKEIKKEISSQSLTSLASTVLNDDRKKTALTLETPVPSTIYFHAAKEDQPYYFDYDKIFNYTNNLDIKQIIKKSCLKNLNHNYKKMTEVQINNMSIDDIVKKNALEIWKELVNDYNLKNKENDDNEKRPLKQYPNNKFYDPKNKELMDNMLSDAFKYLRQNPKYVWAQLPDAHRIPLLREWIYCRYGKTHTHRDRLRAFNFSSKIFKALETIDISIPIPTTASLGKNLFLDYSCRSYLARQIQMIKNTYNKSLNKNILEQSRIFWFAMKGFHCSGGPPYKTFFAYIPSRMRDFQRFRLWRSNEFRKMHRNLDTNKF